MMTGTAAPPLAGKLVIDFTRVLAGPWASLNLADLGADVIKIEHPTTGDDTRHYAASPDYGGEAGYFLFANRNKRSLALDIAKPAGQAVIRRLAERADILIENFRPDVMARQGLDYEALKTVNPSLIYCSISGYGHASPLKLVAGYDPVAQAESGMMWMTGEADGDPLRTGISYADIFTGMFATQAILGALLARERDGKGQFIDLALLDSAIAVTANYAQVALMTGQQPHAVRQWPSVPGAIRLGRNQGRPDQHRDRQRAPVGTLLQGRRAQAGMAHGRALPYQCRPYAACR